jgi:hypothetical protein
MKEKAFTLTTQRKKQILCNQNVQVEPLGGRITPETIKTGFSDYCRVYQVPGC